MIALRVRLSHPGAKVCLLCREPAKPVAISKDLDRPETVEP